MSYLVQPNGTSTRSEVAILLHHSRSSVSQRATDDLCCGVGEVVVADGTPDSVMTNLDSALHGTAAVGQTQLEWSLMMKTLIRYYFRKSHKVTGIIKAVGLTSQCAELSSDPSGQSETSSQINGVGMHMGELSHFHWPSWQVSTSVLQTTPTASSGSQLCLPHLNNVAILYTKVIFKSATAKGNIIV